MASSTIVRVECGGRPGRQFTPTRELPLHDQAVEAVRRLPGARGEIWLLTEMAGPIGIPDVVAVLGAGAQLRARLTAGVPPLTNELDAAIVASCNSQRTRTRDGIAHTLGWPKDTVSRRLPALLRSGALTEVSRSRYLRHPNLGTFGRMYAVEAKVANWRKGVHQGRRYRLWADAYVLVLAGASERVLPQVTDDLKKDGGGLLIQGRWICKPRTRPQPASRRLWATEHLVAAVLSAGYQPSVAP